MTDPGMTRKVQEVIDLLGPALSVLSQPVQGYQQEGNKMLNVGDPAPDFTTFDQTGKEVSLSDLKGQKVWLWFFSSPGGNN